MENLNLENLDTLISKAKELQHLLEESPEILAYLRLINETDARKLFPPKYDDVLLRVGDAAKILGVNSSTIHKYVKSGKLNRYYVEGSSHSRFWRSEVKALAKRGLKDV